MKERLKKIADKTTGSLLMILCCFGMGSCSDDALTDKTTFQLFCDRYWTVDEYEAL